jgi:hypothetical protein
VALHDTDGFVRDPNKPQEPEKGRGPSAEDDDEDDDEAPAKNGWAAAAAARNEKFDEDPGEDEL